MARARKQDFFLPSQQLPNIPLFYQSGAWLTLTWASPVTVGLVVLYDRPNESDNCESGTLTFSDGSVVDFGLLVNDGSATPVQVPTISTTSLTWTCTSVSAWTSNVGLSEIEVYASGGLAPFVFSPIPAIRLLTFSLSLSSATTTALVNGTATASFVLYSFQSGASPPPDVFFPQWNRECLLCHRHFVPQLHRSRLELDGNSVILRRRLAALRRD